MKWPNLKEVHLCTHLLIKDSASNVNGVYYLTKAKWASVTIINLRIKCLIKGGNDFKNEGCLYLREAEWPQLR